jgi:hypothetical protein
MPCGQATPKTAILGLAGLQGRRPVAVFYPFGYPKPYVHHYHRQKTINTTTTAITITTNTITTTTTMTMGVWQGVAMDSPKHH